MAAGSIVIDLLMRTGSFETDTKKAEQRLRKFEGEVKATAKRIGTGVAAIAGAIGGALALVDRMANSIAQYQDLADKVGDTAERFSRLQLAADISGTALDTVAAASVKLTAALSKTDDESSATARALAAINIPLEEFRRLAPTEQLQKVATQLASFADGAGKTAVAVQLFGRAGADLIPFLNDLNETAGESLGLTAQQIEAADTFSKTLARMRSELSTVAKVVAADILPPFQAFIDYMRQSEAASTLLNVAGTALRVTFEALAVLAANIVFVFKGVGREIGAIAAQTVALAKLDINGFRAISNAVKEDAARARAELDAFEARVLRGFSPQGKNPNDPTALMSFSWPGATRPKLNYSGAPAPRASGGGRGRTSPTTAKADAVAAMQATDAVRNALRELEQTDVARLASMHDTLRELLSMENLGGSTPALAQAIANVTAEIDALKAATSGTAILDPQQQMKNDFLRSEKGAYDQVDTAMKQAGETMDEFAKNAAASLQGYLGNTLADIMDGNFKSIGASFTQMINRLVAEALAADLTRKLFGKSAGGSGEGWVGTAIGWLGGMFSGSAAGGGDAMPGRAYWVGEQGPEMFIPRTAGTVLPAVASAAAAGGKQMVVNNTFAITGAVDRRTQMQIAAEVGRTVGTAQRRNA